MALTIVAASLVTLAAILTILVIGKGYRIDDKQLQELEYNRADLDALMEIRRLQSRGW